MTNAAQETYSAQLDLLPASDLRRPDACQRAALGLAPGSASEVWVLGLIEQLQDKLTHRIGENITLPIDLVAHVQSALISGLRAWQDQERLDWLSRKRSPGTVHLTFNGATIAKAQSVRDVIDAAMRGPNK